MDETDSGRTDRRDSGGIEKLALDKRQNLFFLWTIQKVLPPRSDRK